MMNRETVVPGMSWEPHRKLTEREWPMWGLIARGLGNDDIAKEMGFSDKTIQNTIVGLYTKLGIPDGSARRVKLALMYPLRQA